MRKGFESITEFIFMEDKIEKADIILIPGGSHKELMERAVELYKAGYADYILPSGGFNRKIPEFASEHHYLKSIALEQGIPESAILKEDQAAHTFDNAEFSYAVCQKHALKVKKAIIVCKNFHARRSYITYKINFPSDTCFIVQPVVDGKGITKDNWVNSEEKRKVVMGEVKKIGKYFEDHIESLI